MKGIKEVNGVNLNKNIMEYGGFKNQIRLNENLNKKENIQTKQLH